MAAPQRHSLCHAERFSDVSGVWTVRLGRGDRANALNGPLLDALSAVLASEAVRTARLVFLEGDGNVFSAGLDLHWLETLRQGPRAERERAGRALASVLDAVRGIDAPVVGYAARGAFGAGIAVLAAADWIVADRDGRFRLSEARLGISGAILLETLRPKIPEAALRRWVLTAQDFDSAEAGAHGLVAETLDPGAWPARKAAIAAAVAEGARSVQAAFKRALRSPCPAATDGTLLADALENPDGDEGLRAFRERRPPRWR